MHDNSVLLHLLGVLAAGLAVAALCSVIGEQARKRREHRRACRAASVPQDGPQDEREQEIFNGYVLAESRRDPFAYDPMRGRRVL